MAAGVSGCVSTARPRVRRWRRGRGAPPAAARRLRSVAPPGQRPPPRSCRPGSRWRLPECLLGLGLGFGFGLGLGSGRWRRRGGLRRRRGLRDRDGRGSGVPPRSPCGPEASTDQEEAAAAPTSQKAPPFALLVRRRPRGRRRGASRHRPARTRRRRRRCRGSMPRSRCPARGGGRGRTPEMGSGGASDSSPPSRSCGVGAGDQGGGWRTGSGGRRWARRARVACLRVLLGRGGRPGARAWRWAQRRPGGRGRRGLRSAPLRRRRPGGPLGPRRGAPARRPARAGCARKAPVGPSSAPPGDTCARRAGQAEVCRGLPGASPEASASASPATSGAPSWKQKSTRSP